MGIICSKFNMAMGETILALLRRAMLKEIREILENLLPYNREIWFDSPDRIEEGNINRRDESIDQALAQIQAYYEKDYIKKADEWHKKGWEDCLQQMEKMR